MPTGRHLVTGGWPLLHLTSGYSGPRLRLHDHATAGFRGCNAAEGLIDAVLQHARSPGTLGIRLPCYSVVRKTCLATMLSGIKLKLEFC